MATAAIGKVSEFSSETASSSDWLKSVVIVVVIVVIVVVAGFVDIAPFLLDSLTIWLVEDVSLFGADVDGDVLAESVILAITVDVVFVVFDAAVDSELACFVASGSEVVEDAKM